jgi:hypothetical protein
MVPNIDQSIRIFKSKFRFSVGTNTKRSYMLDLKTWRESLLDSGVHTDRIFISDL